MKFELGIEVKDTITNFVGITTAFFKYITGCDQYLVAPPVDRQHKHVKARWYDVNRLTPTKRKKKIILDTEEDNGACEEAPIK